MHGKLKGRYRLIWLVYKYSEIFKIFWTCSSKWSHLSFVVDSNLCEGCVWKKKNLLKELVYGFRCSVFKLNSQCGQFQWTKVVLLPLWFVEALYVGGSHPYLEYVLISGATVCVVGHISDCSVFFHSDCPHRHHHLLSSQHSSVQDVCVLHRGKKKIKK